ncbi:MAG: Outer membrane protein assembly factor BamB [Phycisphaerae bacterium]|nr:Outer membrane protein assembly factor BamB [Phycisphaerae bacterium]
MTDMAFRRHVRGWVLAGMASAWLACASMASAADWPGWRGPNHDCVVPGEQTKVPAWEAAGPLKVWENPVVGSNNKGGLGSVVVAGDRLYLYGTPLFIEPIEERTLEYWNARRLGWNPAKLPDDLLKAVEAARISEERSKLTGNDLNEWIKKFMDERLSADALDKWVKEANDPKVKADNLKRQYGEVIVDRLKRGDKAWPLDVLDKVGSIANKPFKDQAALDKWLDDNGITGDIRKQVLSVIPTTRPRAEDTIYCLKASDGTLVWKKNYPGAVRTYGSSSTPCVADGRVFVQGSDGVDYCLDAKDGNELWTYKGPGGEKDSSFLVVEGLAIAQNGPLTAFDPAKGTVVWKQDKVNTSTNTPTPWVVGGRTLLLCNSGRGRQVACVEAKTGNILWTCPGGSDSTVALGGDMMVVFTNPMMLGYRITPEKAEKVWETKVGGDRGASPAIWKDHVYFGQNGQVVCLKLSDGQACWTGKEDVWEYISAVVADGKLVVVGHGWLSLVAAAPDKFNLLSKVKMPVADCTTPAFADGRMYIRLRDSVACYDPSQSAPAAAPAGKGK